MITEVDHVHGVASFLVGDGHGEHAGHRVGWGHGRLSDDRSRLAGSCSRRWRIRPTMSAI
jgi:hypothetical protein